MAIPTSDADSDIIEESPQQLVIRLLEEHDREFRQKLQFLTSQAKFLADDHAKSTKQLKHAIKQYLGKKQDGVRPSIDPGHKLQPPMSSTRLTPQEDPPIPGVSGTTVEPFNVAVDASDLESMARAARALSESARITQQSTERAQSSTLPADDQRPLIPASLSSIPKHDARRPRIVIDEDEDDQSGDDDDLSVPDIEHESILDEMNDLAQHNLPTGRTPPFASAKTPKPHTNGMTTQETPQSGRDEKGRKWAPGEEDRMIDIIYYLTQEATDVRTKGDMWIKAEAMLRENGYIRTAATMAAKWSMGTRHLCEKRGLTWANDVMKKNPHVLRGKRNAVSLGDAPSTYPEAKRARKSSKKSLHAEAGNSSRTRTPNQPIGHSSELQLRYTFSGASASLVQVDWSPDGQYFAAASNSSVSEDRNFADNRPCNMIHGSVSTKTLRDLPEHRTMPESGQPKYVYQTVSAVKFGDNGRRIYSGGYDNKLRVWNVENETEIRNSAELHFNKKIDVMDVAEGSTTMVATGTASGNRSIRVFTGSSELKKGDFKKVYPLQNMNLKGFSYAPTCLKFGKGQSSHRLIAGFGEDADEDGTPFGLGCMAVWEFTESECVAMTFDQDTAFVSDCTWASSGEMFAVAAVGGSVDREPWANSIVKLYNTGERRETTVFKCSARDINDVTLRNGQVTASCTDGGTYVWDSRMPHTTLLTLMHDLPLDNFGYGVNRELNDVGVRYVEWSDTAGQLYTGSSDGMLKLWDTRRAQADVLVEDVAYIGQEILCGKFSPDYSSLLLGDENAQLHIFEKSKKKLPMEEYRFIKAENWAKE